MNKTVYTTVNFGKCPFCKDGHYEAKYIKGVNNPPYHGQCSHCGAG